MHALRPIADRLLSCEAVSVMDAAAQSESATLRAIRHRLPNPQQPAYDHELGDVVGGVVRNEA